MSHVCCVYFRFLWSNRRDINYDIMPLGISYISSSLKQAGFSTEVLFCTQYNYKRVLNFIDKKPDIFALSIISYKDYVLAQKFIKIIKDCYKNSKVIVGGPFCSLSPNIIKEDNNIDCLCIGAGEKAVPEYVKQAKENNFKKTDNLWIRLENGQIIKCDKVLSIENLDDLPYPDRDMWLKWMSKDFTKLNISVSRGCKNHCIYCSNGSLERISTNRYANSRSVDNIIKELDYIVHKYSDVQYIYFDDDNLLRDVDYFKNLCRSLINFNSKLKRKINFTAKINFISELLIDSEILTLMKKASIVWIEFGLESSSLEIRKKLNRPYYTNEQILQFFETINKLNIKSTCYVMYCFPFETKETYLQTVDFLRKCKPTIIEYSFLTPYKGTPLNELLKKEQKLKSSFVDTYRFFTFRWRVYKKYKSFLESIVLSFGFSFILAIYHRYKLVKEKQQNKYLFKAKFEFDNKNYKEAIKYYNKMIITNDNYWIYLDRAVAKKNIEDYQGAIEDFNKILQLEQREEYVKEKQKCIDLLSNKYGGRS